MERQGEGREGGRGWMEVEGREGGGGEGGRWRGGREGVGRGDHESLFMQILSGENRNSKESKLQSLHVHTEPGCSYLSVHKALNFEVTRPYNLSLL